MPLRIREQPEARPGNALSGEDDPTAELLRLREGCCDIVDVHEERDMPGPALGATDPARDGALHPRHDKLVARPGCLRERPVEQLAVEVAGCIGVL